jgi:hypothetical protein
MGRDLEPGKLEDVLAALKDWWGLFQRISMSFNQVVNFAGHQQQHLSSPHSMRNSTPSPLSLSQKNIVSRNTTDTYKLISKRCLISRRKKV